MSWDDIALACGTDKASNLHGYMEWYEKLLGDHRVDAMCEVGVYMGASLQMWSRIWPDAYIVGFDIAEFEHEPWPDNVGFILGDGPTELVRHVALFGRYDVIIDDGSHHIEDTMRTIDAAVSALADDGWLVIEDMARYRNEELHCSADVLDALRANEFKVVEWARSGTGHHSKGDLMIAFAQRR